MGNNANLYERPEHVVTVPSFELAMMEVTVNQYAGCVTAGNCSEPDTGGGCNWDATGFGYHPVNCVSWRQAEEFCAWAGARLPTEAEWEYAARSAGQNIEYPWGNETGSCYRAVVSQGNPGGAGCGTGRTMSVCSKTPGSTDQGLCDMAGNVSEWVADWYHLDYVGAPSDGSAWVTDVPSGYGRVIRGGSYLGYAAHVTSRGYDVEPRRLIGVGFRCAR